VALACEQGNTSNNLQNVRSTKVLHGSNVSYQEVQWLQIACEA